MNNQEIQISDTYCQIIAKLDSEEVYLEIKKDIKRGTGRLKVKEII